MDELGKGDLGGVGWAYDHTVCHECHDGCNEEVMLLCDRCDRGCVALSLSAPG